MKEGEFEREVLKSDVLAEHFSEEERRNKFRRAVRVAAKYGSDLRKELRSGEIVWYSDASKAVGGKGEYPGALAHFMSGLPLCQMSHYAERAASAGLEIEELEMSVVGHFNCALKLNHSSLLQCSRLLQTVPCSQRQS